MKEKEKITITIVKKDNKFVSYVTSGIYGHQDRTIEHDGDNVNDIHIYKILLDFVHINKISDTKKYHLIINFNFDNVINDFIL